MQAGLLSHCWLLKNPPFTWFDEHTTSFDGPVLSEVEGLKANGRCFENIENFTFVLSLVEALKLFFNSLITEDQQT